MRTERNENTATITTKRKIRFPTDEEIVEFLDEALPMAQKEADKHGLEVEDWMIAEAICRICPEIKQCDQQRLVQAVNRVIQRQIK